MEPGRTTWLNLALPTSAPYQHPRACRGTSPSRRRWRRERGKTGGLPDERKLFKSGSNHPVGPDKPPDVWPGGVCLSRSRAGGDQLPANVGGGMSLLNVSDIRVHTRSSEWRNDHMPSKVVPISPHILALPEILESSDHTPTEHGTREAWLTQAMHHLSGGFGRLDAPLPERI